MGHFNWLQAKWIKALLIFSASAVLLVVTFQNCSPVKFEDIEAPLRAAALERERIGADSESITAGLNQVPELKMFFVVDNSGTMRQNQLNLAQSFGSMFDATSVSLNKFDSTTYLMNTAQTLGAYQSDAERTAIFDFISNQQAPFANGASVAKNIFDTAFRTADLNTGAIPGDNLGFSLSKSTNPLSYELSPAVVMGAGEKDGQILFSPEIKMKALSDVNQVENEFKNRLAVMNADRFPQQLVGGKYVPQHSQVVDTESGLCSVARILRNPASFIQPGQLVSFTLVTDENDNDPTGSKCVQSVKELVGTEKLIDVDCKKNQTTISYQPPTTIDTPDKCKLNGDAGYKFEYSYSNPNKISTTIEYYALKSAEKYTAYFYNLKYKVFDKNTYKYNYTKVQYYLNECYDVYSDGNKVGVKCTPKANPEPAKYFQGALAGTCYELAKTFDPNALNVAGKMPICSDEVKDIASCNTSDARCTSAPTYKDFSANSGNPIAGKVPATQTDCDNEAKKDTNYVSGAVCSSADKPNLANCTGQPAAAVCVETTAKVYGYITKTPTGDNKGADNCESYVIANYTDAAKAKAASDSKSFIKTCTVNSSAVADTKISGVMSFFNASGFPFDGGTQLAINDDCGKVSAVLDEAFKIASPKDAKLLKTNTCKITGINAAAETAVNRTLATCDDHAAKRCTDDKLRNCKSLLVGATSLPSNGAVTIFKVVPEKIACNSKCGDSTMSLCDAGTAPETLVSDFLIAKYGARTICSAATTVVEAGKTSFISQLESQINNICKKDPVDNAPTYPYQTKGPYYSNDKVTDYVSGSVKNEQGKYVPAQDLISFIKAKIAELKANQFVFTALIQKSSDPAPTIGSKGVEYEKLIATTGGQVDSVKANDYSVALKELSRVLKNSLERSFLLKKMRPDQIIKKVSLVKKADGSITELANTLWSQSGNTLKVAESLEFVDGDQFQVDFQNDVE